MNLCIEIYEGKPINHPIQQSNMEMIYPGIDFQNLPENYCKFVRIERPSPKWDEMVEGPEYKIIEGICYDVWTINKISDEERQKKIDELVASNPYPSWTIDYENYNIIPLIPYPEQGSWTWDESTLSWVEYVEPTEPEA
jgi:hypothetical protein